MRDAADSPFLFRLAAIGVACVFLIALAPTLRWQEFTSGPENLVVTTAMEMHRGGPKFVPNLQGEKRIAKPPLPAWLTYFSISPSTMAQVASADARTRFDAFETLAFQARLPAILASALLIIATYELGRAVRSPRVGLLSACIVGSTLLLLRFGRHTTTDIQLALWVTVANACIAHGVCRGKIKLPWIGGGVALGLAMMCKGPVCLLQTLLPAAAFVIYRREKLSNFRLTPAIIGVLLFIAVGLSWYLYVFATTPGVMARWFSEVSRVDARDASEPGSRVYAYLAFIPFLFPWIVFFIVGVAVIASKEKRQSLNDLLPLFMAIVPVLVMTLFKDRQERYLLPMIAPAAVVAAIGLREHLASWHQWSKLDTFVTNLHWLVLGLPLVIVAIVLRERTMLIAAAIVAMACVAGAIIHRRKAVALPAMTLAIVLGMQAVVMRWYAQSERGISDLRPLAEAIVTECPDAEIFAIRPDLKRPPPDLAVYLNRMVRAVPSVADIPDSRGSMVILTIQRKNEPEPRMPAGFRFVKKELRDKKDYWWAFARP